MLKYKKICRLCDENRNIHWWRYDQVPAKSIHKSDVLRHALFITNYSLILCCKSRQEGRVTLIYLNLIAQRCAFIVVCRMAGKSQRVQWLRMAK